MDLRGDEPIIVHYGYCVPILRRSRFIGYPNDGISRNIVNSACYFCKTRSYKSVATGNPDWEAEIKAREYSQSRLKMADHTPS